MMAGIALIVGATGSYLAFAGQQGNDPMGGGMMRGGMMNRGGAQRGMMGNNAMMPMMREMMTQNMMQSMAQEGLVATSDGGLVVLAAGKLMKYDGSLNLVKEVDLKVDYENMQQRMQRMMESMPMMRSGMMRGSGGNTGGDGTQQ